MDVEPDNVKGAGAVERQSLTAEPVNEAPDILNAVLFSASPSLAEAAVSEPEWVSPLADDGYEEFWNERFLQRLDLLDNADKSCTPLRNEEQMTAGQPSSRAGEARRTQLEVSVSIRTLLLIAGVVAVAWALASIASVLLVIFVSLFSIAVLSPVVSAMERRLRWSRRLSSAVLVLAIVIVLGAVVLVVTQAIVGAVRDFSDDLPRIVDEARQSDLGSLINGGSDSLDTLAQHAGEITGGVAKVSGGVADVGVSAFGVVTLVFSVMFLTLFGLIDEPRLRDWIGGLLYRGDRERFLQVTDRIVQTTSRYMLGNLAISVICGTVYGVTAVILGVPYPLALAVIAGILDLIPSIGATIAGIIVAIAALSVSPTAFVGFLIVMVVYQQIENYILQPTIIGKAARISGFTVLASVLAFGALFGLIGAIIGVPIAASIQIVVEELTAARRARIAAADAAE